MSAAAFTDSTAPATSPLAYVRPTSGKSTKTTSPRASCACTVMPTTAASCSSSWIHSCSCVYLTVMCLAPGCWFKFSAAHIAWRDERHGRDGHRHGLAAHDGLQARSLGRARDGHVRHCHRHVDARPEHAAGHRADATGIRVEQFGVLAHRDALQLDEADALALQRHGAIELLQHALGARDAAGAGAAAAAHLLDRPGQ